MYNNLSSSEINFLNDLHYNNQNVVQIWMRIKSILDILEKNTNVSNMPLIIPEFVYKYFENFNLFPIGYFNSIEQKIIKVNRKGKVVLNK